MIFHRHKWTDWAVTERGNILEPAMGHAKIGTYLIQERYCPGCGKTEIGQEIAAKGNGWSTIRQPTHNAAKPKHDRTPA